MTERSFWNNKYADGGISGLGSIGKYKRWKWREIIKVVDNIRNKSVVDVGCGDMSFWETGLLKSLRPCKEYVGIDISNIIQELNKIKYSNRTFLTGNAVMPFYGISGEIVLAMDLLFHIMQKEDFITILIRLCEYSEKWVIIYNWRNNPFGYKELFTDGVSQYYRNLSYYDDVFIDNDFKIVKTVICPYDEFGALYFYKKVNE